MFTYCENNPISRKDSDGYAWKDIWNEIEDWWNDVKSALDEVFLIDYDNKHDTDLSTSNSILGGLDSLVEISKLGNDGAEDIKTHGNNISGCINDPNYKVNPLSEKMDWEYNDYNQYCHQVASEMGDIYTLGMGLEIGPNMDYNTQKIICINDHDFHYKWRSTYEIEMIEEGKDFCNYPF